MQCSQTRPQRPHAKFLFLSLILMQMAFVAKADLPRIPSEIAIATTAYEDNPHVLDLLWEISEQAGFSCGATGRRLHCSNQVLEFDGSDELSPSAVRIDSYQESDSPAQTKIFESLLRRLARSLQERKLNVPVVLCDKKHFRLKGNTCTGQRLR